MKLALQKRLAAAVLKSSKNRVRFNPTRLEQIKEAITKFDIRRLAAEGSISVSQEKGVSRVRARHRQVQRGKGRQKGHGSRKGKQNARLSCKETWINRIRLQRRFLAELKSGEYLDNATYNMLYKKAKGGFFRSKRHIKLYIEEHNLVKHG